MRILFLFLIVVIILGCNKSFSSKDKKEILALKEMSDLATVEYTISKVVKANDNKTWYKIGDRKILMSVMAYVKAGIDLSLIKEENISYQNKTIHIILPTAKVISMNIPPEEIKQEMTDIGALRQNFTNEEKNALLVQAEQSIQQSIDSLGILKKAEENAKLFIENFVKKLGHQNVHVTIGATKQK